MAKRKSKTDVATGPLTLREAAHVLGLSTRTLREHLHRGQIEGRIFDGQWRSKPGVRAPWVLWYQGKRRMKKRKKSETDAPPIGDRLLTLPEAADVLRLSTRTVREYLQRGEIEGRIIGWMVEIQACGP